MPAGQLNLGTQWGPFSAAYLGVSRILDAAQGTMADLALYVGRRNPATVILPDNIFGYVHNWSGEHRAVILATPEEVAPDYSSFALRYWLDPQGDTALARFVVAGADGLRVDITFRNDSDEEREYFYGLGLSVVDPRKKVRLKESLRPWWIAARQYAEIESYRQSFGLGTRRCLTRTFAWGVEEQVLAQAFGGWAGDRVLYRVTPPKALQNGFLYFRYVKYGRLTPTWELRINGRAHTFRLPQTWAIPGGGLGKSNDAYEEWRLLRVPVGTVEQGEMTLELRSVNPPGNDHAQIWLDGMLLSEGLLPGDDGTAELLPPSLCDEPLHACARVELESRSGPAAPFRISLPGAPDQHATVHPEEVNARAEGGRGSFLAHLRRRYGLPPVSLERDAGVCPWGAMESEPIFVPARSERTARFTFAVSGTPAAAAAVPQKSEPVRGPYAEMIARLKDALLFNVNYPLSIFNGPSAFYVPAKHFPVPYSWDGGFVAVGMATFAPELALQQAAYYMTEEKHGVPFLYCASPVPTMLYALWDIYQATQDRSVLARSWDGARRMYDFYLGRTPGSIVNAGRDGLLSTYPYYGNLGMDDHPIQRWAEERQITHRGLYSIILIAQILRIARIMRNVATILGRDTEAEQCRLDAELLAGVVDGRMWDEESGLYGWLCRTERGVERAVVGACAGDRSACAFLPLFAGQITHKERLLPQMLDPQRFWTPFGISSVDMRSPVYSPHGYWNGGIWPVLQWYLWRGLLEAGEPVLARRVADAILGAWQRCYTAERYLGEHFSIALERMSGAPNFGGLSAALLPMHAAYFTPYEITTCYDVILLRRSADRARDALTFSLMAPFLSAPSHDLLVNMGRPKTRYALQVNGQPAGEVVSDDYGHLELRLPRPSGQYEVRITPALKG